MGPAPRDPPRCAAGPTETERRFRLAHLCPLTPPGSRRRRDDVRGRWGEPEGAEGGASERARRRGSPRGLAVSSRETWRRAA